MNLFSATLQKKHYLKKNNTIILFLIVINNTFFSFSQVSNGTSNLKKTETGIIVYEAIGVEGVVNQIQSENKKASKPINEFNLIECENSIVDIENKIAVVKYEISEAERLKKYEAYREELIQRKQFLLGQTTTK